MQSAAHLERRILFDMKVQRVEFADLRELLPIDHDQRLVTKVDASFLAQFKQRPVDSGDGHTQRFAELDEAQRQRKPVLPHYPGGPAR